MPSGLSEPFLRYLEARGILLTLEGQEALGQIVRVLVFVGLAGFAVLIGWLLLTGLAVDLVMTQAHWSWQQAALALAGFHLVIAFIFLLATRNRLASMRWFGDTINEFRKDRAWLSSQTGKR
ncbi:MAG TPA: phage holin family protein [Candidatus Saccharimonadia bacterium]|nr:phage holin family protein [Candidatus Saccharimonadia bacterium]